MKQKKILSIAMILCIVFSFTFSAFATPDSYESNETYDAAADISVFWYFAISANLDTSTDVDYYYFIAKDTGNLRIKLTPPSGQNYAMTIVSSSGQPIIASADAGAGNPEYCQIQVTKDRLYYIIVGNDTTNYTDSSYTLSKDSFTATLDAAYEPNNTMSQSAYVPLSTSPVFASISSDSDIDFYNFYANSSGSFSISLIPPSGHNYDIIVIDTLADTTVAQSHLTGSQTDTATFNAVNGRNYTVWIYGVNYDYYSNVPYQLFKSN